MAILELKDVTKKFGGLTAVDGVNLKVEENQICALIGPNGAGKTTVFNMITGAYQVTSGDVVFNGESICGKKPHQIVEKGIARTFQNIRLFKSATVLENVMTGFHCKTKTGMFNVIFNYRKCMQEEAECREKALEILRFLGLEDVKDLEARNIPYGHQRLLEIGRALATSPKLLLLDEPAAGMNSQEKKELVNTIRKIPTIWPFCWSSMIWSWSWASPKISRSSTSATPLPAAPPKKFRATTMLLKPTWEGAMMNNG